MNEVLAAIKVDSPESFTFAGRSIPVQNGHRHGSTPHNGGNVETQVFVATLSAQLYEFAYSRTFSKLREPETYDFSTHPGLLDELSAANTTRERWEHGWKIAQILPHGQISAQKGNQRRSLWPGQFLSHDGPAAMLRNGAEISIFFARESRSLQSGFYYAFGETPEDDKHGFGLVRIYWNVSLEGAAKLIGGTTTRLNRFHVPFRLKCVTARSQFERTDGAVVYLAKRFFPIAADAMIEVHDEVAEFLGDDVPLFSKKIAKGVGVAEDPGTGESFGQSRCQRLAQSIWNCYSRGEQSTKARLSEFDRLLREGGIDPKHPHLSAGSIDWYALPAERL
jgi:hypothetical protein